MFENFVDEGDIEIHKLDEDFVVTYYQGSDDLTYEGTGYTIAEAFEDLGKVVQSAYQPSED